MPSIDVGSEEPDVSAPLLSIIIIIASDTLSACSAGRHLGGCLAALGRQVDAPPFEMIVPYRPPLDGIEQLKREYPTTMFVAVESLKDYAARGGSREHHDQLRARGLLQARGEIVGLLEDYDRPDPHWCAHVVEAHCHQYPAYAAVGGAIENGIDRALNWAVYFCDFGKYQNPLPAGDTTDVSDINASYKRSALDSILCIWQEVFRETAVNLALRSRGEKLVLSPAIVVYQFRGDLRIGSALVERFIWGRSYAATRSQLVGSLKRVLLAALTPALPAVLLARMITNIARKGRGAGAFITSSPFVLLLTVSWSCGELVGYLTARPHVSA